MFPENITALYGVDKFKRDVLIIGPLSCLDHRCINFFPSLSKKEFSCQKATALDYSFRFLFTQQISKKVYTHTHKDRELSISTFSKCVNLSVMKLSQIKNYYKLFR